jgi:type IV fimbrial biogenesis protein FimT
MKITNRFLSIEHGHRRNRGFTMIELMVVIVVIGITAAMAAPMFTRIIPRIKTKAEARNILNFMREARSRAIAENTQYGVYLNINNRQYILFKDTTNPSTAIYESADSTAIGPITLDPNVVYSSTSFANNCVVFLPTGAASQSGSVNINSTQSDAAYSIAVLAATGKCKLQ